MADGGQRLLDVIDDPRALESFLGSLTSDDLLQSSNSNVVEQLTNSLEAEYGIDSPNDTLFDTLESSTNLTDISQSNVPFDFGSDQHGLDPYSINTIDHYTATSSNMATSSVSTNSDHFDLGNCTPTLQQQQQLQQLQQQQYNNVSTSNTCDASSTSFNLSSSNNNTLSNTNITISSSSSNSTFSSNSSSVGTASQYSSAISLSSETYKSQEQQHQQNLASSDQVRQLQLAQQQVQMSSQSSNNILLQPSLLPTSLSSNSASPSSMISINTINNSSHPNLQQPLTGTANNFQQHQLPRVIDSSNIVIPQKQQQFDTKPNSMPPLSGISGSSQPSTPTNSAVQVQFSAADTANNNATMPATTIATQQTITAAQFAQIMQHAQQQAVIGPQIIANAAGGLQLQQHAQQPSFLIDSNGQLVATGGPPGTTSFSAANLALLATGGVQPTYAVLAQPSAQQIFSANTITMQPQATIQTIKNPNGSTTYFQTSTQQIIGTNHIQQATTNSVVASVGSVANSPNAIVRPKPPPQLLPKPSASTTKSTSTPTISNAGTGNNSPDATTNASNNGTSTVSSSNSTASTVNTMVSSNNVIGCTSTTTSAPIVTSIATPITTNSISIDTLSQLFQQHNQQQTIASTGLTFSQPSFAIGPNGMVVSGVNNLNTMTASPHAYVLNQFGQQMIVPAVGQTGIQLILRQQPAQPQVLTIQAPATIGAQTGAGKPIVRYISQVPQVAQTHATVQLQQIQTPNGPQWITVRTTPAQIQPQMQSQLQQATTTSVPTVSQASSEQVQAVKSSPAPQPPPTPPQPQPPVRQQPQILKPAPAPPTVQPSPEPPKKKAKQSKKKVTIDLNDLFKKAGIESGDFEDDGFDFNFGAESSFDSLNSLPSTPMQNGSVQDKSQYSKKVNGTPDNNNTRPMPTINLPHVSILKPVDKTKQKKTQKSKAKQSVVSPSVPIITTPPKSPKGKEKKLLEPPIINLSPFYDTNNTNSKTPPKSKAPAKGKGKKAAQNKEPVIIPPPPIIIPPPSPVEPPAKKKKYYPKKKKDSPAPISTNNTSPGPPPIILPPPSGIRPVVGSSPVSSTANSSIPTELLNSVARVHTITLTAQNQQLLCNIQIQINKLVAISMRNENEETALQKLRVLQQQVIGTGVSVPNPPQVQMQTLSGVQGTVTSSGMQLLNSLSSSISSSTQASHTVTTGTISTSSTNVPSTISSNVENHVQQIPVNNLKANISLSQPPPLILNNKVVKSSSSTKPHSSTTTPKPTVVQHAQSVINNSLNKNILAVTTNSTTKRAILISVANNAGQDNKSTPSVTRNTSTNSSILDSSANTTTTVDDKVTSSTGKTTTTTTISTSSGGTQQYQNKQQYYQQQPPPILIRTIIDDKKSEELRLAKLKQEEEAKAKHRKEQFEARLKEDQDSCVAPDFETPFGSMKDMFQRLSNFHVVRERNEMTFEDFDEDFGKTACVLIDKFNGMVAKYRGLLLRESMREVPCCEHVMLDRIWVGEEKAGLEQDKNYVAQGETLDLPPPPSSWIPQIDEYVENELKEMERDSIVNQQVQSAIDSITSFGNDNSNYALPDESDKEILVDAFGVPISSSGYGSGMISSSSADIDEAVRSILS